MRRSNVVALLALTAQLALGASCADGLAEHAEARTASLLLVGEALVDSALRDHALSLGLDALENVPVPRPSNLDEFILDEEAAISLGKALFWDMQVGSDGQACASCHFHAGADDRVKNQLTPGLLRVVDPTRDPDPDVTFGDANGRTASNRVAGPNYTLKAHDFPFHQLEDPDDRESCVDGEDNDGDNRVDFDDKDCFDMNDSTSSQGTFGGVFISLGAPLLDVCEEADDPIFQVNGTPVRKVEPRNTPTMINAVFNHRNFWDGRANNIFNGLNPFGERGLIPTLDNPNPGTLVVRNGVVVKEQVRIDNASLASQSVGPPPNDFEMSCAGRTFADIGRKLLDSEALAFQEVHEDDSVLGDLRDDSDGLGLTVRYAELVQQAFHSRYWSGAGSFDPNGDPVVGDGFTQAEVNFPLFFGLSIQLYESTLVSDQTDFDDFMNGDDDALSDVAQFGLEVFLGDGKCVNCHGGAEFTEATVRVRANQPDGNEQPIERMIMGDGGVAVYDGGFYNIGVRPTLEDLGVGGEILGFPISFARQEVTGDVIDDFNFDEDEFEVPGPIVQGERVAVDGAFKTPGLRNAEFTGPYFHNGSRSTLRQVVDFYDRGGDRIGTQQSCDTTGFDGECSNLDPDIQRLGLDEMVRDFGGVEVTAAEALVEFLLELSDQRVEDQAAPFDHPQIFVPDGHQGNQFNVVTLPSQAVTKLREIEATGADGDGDLDPFLDLHPQDL